MTVTTLWSTEVNLTNFDISGLDPHLRSCIWSSTIAIGEISWRIRYTYTLFCMKTARERRIAGGTLIENKLPPKRPCGL